MSMTRQCMFLGLQHCSIAHISNMTTTSKFTPSCPEYCMQRTFQTSQWPWSYVHLYWPVDIIWRWKTVLFSMSTWIPLLAYYVYVFCHIGSQCTYTRICHTNASILIATCSNILLLCFNRLPSVIPTSCPQMAGLRASRLYHTSYLGC